MGSTSGSYANELSRLSSRHLLAQHSECYILQASRTVFIINSRTACKSAAAFPVAQPGKPPRNRTSISTQNAEGFYLIGVQAARSHRQPWTVPYHSNIQLVELTVEVGSNPPETPIAQEPEAVCLKPISLIRDEPFAHRGAHPVAVRTTGVANSSHGGKPSFGCFLFSCSTVISIRTLQPMPVIQSDSAPCICQRCAVGMRVR